MTVAANGTEEVRQNPRLTQAGYDSLNSQHPADLHVVVSYLESGQPRTILDQTSQTLITSRDDFPWSIKGFTPQENYDLVVAMITPTDPSVNALIRTAANYDPSQSMTSGYDSAMDENGTVWQRLSDIWEAETNDYSLTYISTPITFAANQSQRIRLPGEVLDQSSGNCIELTLLYAAAVEYLGMQSALVIVPGHAYVAVRLDNTDRVLLLRRNDDDRRGDLRSGDHEGPFRMEDGPAERRRRRDTAGSTPGSIRPRRPQGRHPVPIPWR